MPSQWGAVHVICQESKTKNQDIFYPTAVVLLNKEIFAYWPLETAPKESMEHIYMMQPAAHGINP